MIPVLDAGALVCLLLGDPGAEEVASLLGGGSEAFAANIGEAVDELRRRGADPHRAVVEVERLLDEGVSALAIDRTVALRGAALRAQHHAGHPAASLADCTAVAAAERVGGTVVTTSAAVDALAWSIGVAAHRLGAAPLLVDQPVMAVMQVASPPAREDSVSAVASP
ncbi:PIN domain-containing protein [Aquihabitans sp. McL0605]|uniref:PIN domain-containing protein n=1 Tax=Aquihabitans sp. McL0605 TaxID=3415671 RepID=UPI003CEC8944